MFDYAVQYVAAHPDIEPTFEVTEEMVDEFRAFIKEKDFDYKTSLQVVLEELRETVAEEEQDSLFGTTLDSLEQLVLQEKQDDFDRSLDYIRKAIKREILSSIVGQRGVYEQLILKTDKGILQAVEVLQTPGQYSELIEKGQTNSKAELN